MQELTYITLPCHTRVTQICKSTRYSNLYYNSKWGGFLRPLKITNADDLEIIQNRNNFAEAYNIEKLLTNKIPKYVYDQSCWSLGDELFDHQEIYMNKNGDYVYVCSPYNHFNEDRAGWSKIYPLYALTANTYVKVIPRLRKKNFL